MRSKTVPLLQLFIVRASSGVFFFFFFFFFLFLFFSCFVIAFSFLMEVCKFDQMILMRRLSWAFYTHKLMYRLYPLLSYIVFIVNVLTYRLDQSVYTQTRRRKMIRAHTVCHSPRKHAFKIFDPLKPHFYIVKLGFTGIYIICIISAQKHRLWALVRTASPRRF